MTGGENMDKKTNAMTSDELFETFFFFVSFIPYIWLMYNGINGFVFAFRGAAHFYGSDAMIMSLFFSPLVILVPISLIYQIRFAIKHFGDHRALLAVSLILVVCTIAGFIAVNPLSRRVMLSRASKDPDKIHEYLSNKYGDDFAAGITVKKDLYEHSETDRFYRVTTAVLPKGEYFTVRNEPHPKDVYFYSDDLIEVFAKEGGPFEKEFSDHLDDEYDLPDNMDIKPLIKSIEFGDYRSGDQYSDLFDRTDYEIDKIDIYVNEHTERSVRDSIDKVWKDICPSINDKLGYLLTLYIEDRDYHMVYANIIDDGNEQYVKIRDDEGNVFGTPVEDYRIDLER